MRSTMALNSSTETGLNNTGMDTLWVQHTLLPNLILSACFLTGIPGNSFVLWIILTKFPQRSFTIALILNLAMADLMALLTVPFWIYDFATSWNFGEASCKLLVYFNYLTMYASIFLITLMSLHRFAVVVLPVASKRWQRPHVVYITFVGVWLLAVAFASPTLIFTSSQNVEGDCSDDVYGAQWQQIVDNVVETLFSFVIPFAVIAICYSCVARKVGTLKFHQKMKTKKLILAVVGGFFVCWLPYHIFSLLTVCALLLQSTFPGVAKTLDHADKVVSNIHWAVAFLSSTVNPILYAFAAQSFRGELQGTGFAKLFFKLHEDTDETSANTTTTKR
uniref:Leukotriene B4 receptor 1-like n=2 Tax=Podarcis muralis TaxID=64176 RepID=A0A670IIR5_PODMU